MKSKQWSASVSRQQAVCTMEVSEERSRSCWPPQSGRPHALH
jgi:hypothetical protein